MAIIQSGSSSSVLTIDTTSTAARTTLYDTSGNAMCDVVSLNNVLNALNASVAFTLGGQSTVGINVSGTTGVLVLSFEATLNNINWFSINATPVAGGSIVSFTNTDGQWLADISGFYAIRTRISSFTSGSMTVSLVVAPYGSKNISQTITSAGTLSVSQGTPNSLNNGWPVEITDGSNILGTPSHPIKIDPTGTTTQPVSGTVTANAGSGTFTVSGTVSSTQSGTWTVQPGNTANTTPWLTSISQAGNTVIVTGGGALKVDGSAVTQPISGTVTANAGTGTFTVGGTVATTQSGTWTVQPGNTVNTTPWLTTINQGGNSAAVTAGNALKVDGSTVTQPVSGIVTANAGSGTFAVSGTVSATQSGTWTMQPGNTANTTPWLATINQGGNSASVTASNALKVDGSAVTQPISGTTTSNQGTANTLANAWTVKITDATNGPVAVKAGSTAAVASDASMVVGLSPNSPLPNLATVDAGNSSTSTLGSNAVFTGTGTSGLGFCSIVVSVVSIGASAPPGTLSIQQSSDNTNWDVQDNYSVSGGTSSPAGEFDIAVHIKAKFYRVVYTNGATAQTAFRLQTLVYPIYTPEGNSATQKGIQAQSFVPVQQPKDAGRVVKIYEATTTTGVTTEAMLTLTPLTGFVSSATGTSFSVTSGKTFRIQAISVTVTATTTTAVGGKVYLRISSSGTVTTATAMTAVVGVASGTLALAGAATGGQITFPDGLELSGTMQFGLSQVVSSTSSTVSASIIGYEY